MVSFKFLSASIAAMASLTGLAHAEEDWGAFAGQVTNVNYIANKDYSLVSELIISLNQGWTLADLQGRTAGQIHNKTIALNTADSKYYSQIGYTATSTNVTDTQVCFEPVPIQISLNQKVDSSEHGRVVNGYFFIGCVDKSKIVGYPSASSTTLVVAPSANSTALPHGNTTATVPAQVNGAQANGASLLSAGAIAVAMFVLA